MSDFGLSRDEDIYVKKSKVFRSLNLNTVQHFVKVTFFFCVVEVCKKNIDESFPTFSLEQHIDIINDP